MNKMQRLINEALRNNAGQSLRSEDIKNFSKLYVDAFDVNSLASNANQIVSGRRGSGKTILLGALHEHVHDKMWDKNVVSFKFSAQNFLVSPQGVELDTKTTAYFCLQSFIQSLAQKFLDYADKVLESKGILHRLGFLTNETYKEKFIDLVLELVELSMAGSILVSPGLISDKKTSSEKQEDSHCGDVSCQGDLKLNNNPGLALKLSGGYKKGKKIIETVTSETKHSFVRGFEASKLKKKIVELLELLQIDYLILIIDEWMVLKSLQVEFAENLKRVFFGENKIAIKIGADPYLSKFNNCASGNLLRGLEVGADIFCEVDLSVPLHGPNMIAIFAKILRKRLCFFCSELNDKLMENEEGDNYLVKEIFNNERAFEELCHASQGLPRNFLDTFKNCTKAIGYDIVDKQIDVDTIRQSLVKTIENNYDFSTGQDSGEILLNDYIKEYVFEACALFFFVKRSDSERIDGMNDLLAKRKIHTLPVEYLHPTLRGEYMCYELDYPLFLSWIRDIEYVKNVGKIQEQREKIKDIDINKIDDYKISFTLSAKDEKKVCRHCGLIFSVYEKCYIIKSLCPHCYEENA